MFGKRELVSVYVEPWLFGEIEVKRGKTSRSTYVEEILKEKHEKRV